MDELHQKQEAGENLIILDLRSRGEIELNRLLIRGALPMSPDEMPHRVPAIPRDRDIVLYCSCPNEVSSARTALLLRRNGIHRVGPLLGGIDAWRARNYPMERRAFSLKLPEANHSRQRCGLFFNVGDLSILDARDRRRLYNQ